MCHLGTKGKEREIPGQCSLQAGSFAQKLGKKNKTMDWGVEEWSGVGWVRKPGTKPRLQLFVGTEA